MSAVCNVSVPRTFQDIRKNDNIICIATFLPSHILHCNMYYAKLQGIASQEAFKPKYLEKSK